MRTTVDLPDDLFRELKSLAALQGMSLKELVRAALQHELANAHKPETVADRAAFPLLKSKEPGKLRLSNADIDDLLT